MKVADILSLKKPQGEEAGQTEQTQCTLQSGRPVIRGRPSDKRAIYICGQPRWSFVLTFSAASFLIWYLSCGRCALGIRDWSYRNASSCQLQSPQLESTSEHFQRGVSCNYIFTI
ncbi:PRA1 family protein A1-like protein [Drosera capensis]